MYTAVSLLKETDIKKYLVRYTVLISNVIMFLTYYYIDVILYNLCPNNTNIEILSSIYLSALLLLQRGPSLLHAKSQFIFL